MGSIIPEVEDDKIVWDVDKESYLIKDGKELKVYNTLKGKWSLFQIHHNTKGIRTPEDIKKNGWKLTIHNKKLYDELIGLQLIEEI